jgi:hypothetical protein
VAAAAVVSGEGCLANAAAAASVPARATLVPLCIATPLKAATTVFFYLHIISFKLQIINFFPNQSVIRQYKTRRYRRTKIINKFGNFFLNFLLQFIYFLMQ